MTRINGCSLVIHWLSNTGYTMAKGYLLTICFYTSYPLIIIYLLVIHYGYLLVIYRLSTLVIQFSFIGSTLVIYWWLLVTAVIHWLTIYPLVRTLNFNILTLVWFNIPTLVSKFSTAH